MMPPATCRGREWRGGDQRSQGGAGATLLALQGPASRRRLVARAGGAAAVKKPYSPKILSNKKSSAFLGTRSELPGARHPVQYHPSRAWNRRGRLRELRIRSYYEQRLLRKVFEEWKEEWWVFHHEWKLRVRADCHYRYYLYNLMFQTWKAYVHQQREMRNKYMRAEGHDAKQKMRQAWKSWLIYVVFRRTKLQMQTTALEFRQRSILWVWWREWRQRLGQVRVGRALHASAVKHSARSLQLQAWSRWQEQLLHVWRERQKVVSAVKHHQHWQQRRALKAWLEYLQVRRVKRQRNETAERFHHVTMLQTHFCDWQWAWERRESLHAHHARVEGLARRMVLRRALTHWKHYQTEVDPSPPGMPVISCSQGPSEDAARRKAAEEHRQHTLLNIIATQVYQIVVTVYSEEADTAASVLVALPRLSPCWLLASCPSAAFVGFDIMSSQESLEKQVFVLWRQKMFQHQEHRLAERLAILHLERQLLRRSWSTWHQQAAACRLELQQQAVACAHHRLGRLRKAFSVWRERARGLRTERMGRAQAAQFQSAQLLRGAWSRWKECLALRGAERQKLMRAGLHHRHTLLSRALQTWGIYQSHVRSILQEAAARESQHERRVLRDVLHRWRENAVAQADEAKKASRAAAHYRRTLCSKVLTEWQEVASVQIFHRQQEECAIREAQVVLSRGCLRTWFRRWRDRSQRAAQRRVRLERAAQHHHRQLLLQALARWKAHHLGCVRKRALATYRGTWTPLLVRRPLALAVGGVRMGLEPLTLCCPQLLQRQATRLLARTLSRACFRQWRQQVWTAWLGFVLERRRKKARQERAVQVYHQQLLREGITRLLRFAAGTKAFRQQLHAQQQVQAAHSLHRAVRRCATIWKQKALGPGREPRPPTSTVSSRRVTFEGPLPSHVAAGAGDASLDIKRPPTPHGPRGAPGSLASAAGDPQLLELNAARWARKQPRRPNFLLEPLQSQTPLGHGTLRGQGPEALWDRGLGVVQPAGPCLTTPFLAKARTALDPGSPLPSVPGLKLPPVVSAGWEQLPPPSFLSSEAAAPARVSARPTPQASPSLAGVPKPHLLLPGDFTARPGGCDAAGVHLRPVGASSTRATPGTRDPWFHPGPNRQDGEDQACLSVATSHSSLEAELEGIQQQLQDYQTMKQNLRSCQRQASSLRRWLELSREESRPEDQEAEQQVHEELQEVELQIQQLASEIQARRQPIRACIARVQALRQALC
ncbi:spindle assembly associated Sfi1 isoform b isoform 1-like protein [Camelus ferus]|nr:spindle assembly associated Sfi1 isoform b isoform 1-like protein [Camelus ferus]